MYQFDVALTRLINGFAGTDALLDSAMIWISAIGVPVLVAAVALQWWRKDNRAHVRHAIIAAGLSFCLGLALNQFVLLFVQRVRPYNGGISHLLVSKSADPSFPSDHATASVAIAAAFLFHGLRRTGLWFLGAAILIMVSRVYVGSHYPSDVLGGAVTATVANLVVLALFREGTRIDRTLTSIW